MPAYDSSIFNPPAPLATVALRNPDNGITVPGVIMLIDSGADVTLIPQDSVNKLGVSSDPYESYELMGFGGHVSAARVIKADLIFLKRIYRGKFLIIDQAAGVLGRDIINHTSLLLDGPGLSWHEQKPSET
jgi:hypothetical protein